MRVAIEPDLAGERKAPWDLILQFCYLPLSAETDLTLPLSAVICCSPVWCYCLFDIIYCCLLLLFAALHSYLQLFASVRYDFLPFILSSSSLLFAAMRVPFSKTFCSYLLPFGAICCSLILLAACCCCLLLFARLLLFAAVCLHLPTVCCYLLLFAAVCCCLLLFVAVCR